MCFCGKVPPESAGKKKSFPSPLLGAADSRESAGADLAQGHVVHPSVTVMPKAPL